MFELAVNTVSMENAVYEQLEVGGEFEDEVESDASPNAENAPPDSGNSNDPSAPDVNAVTE